MQHDLFTAIEEIGTIPYNDKNSMLTLALSVTWYFNGLCTRQAKEAVLTVFDEYCQLVEGKIRWTSNPNTGKWKKIKNPNSDIHPSDWVLDADSIGRWFFTYHGGDQPADASDIGFTVFGGPAGHFPSGQISCESSEVDPTVIDSKDLKKIHCCFPVSVLNKGSEFFKSLLVRWNGILQPYHGRAGLSFSKSGYSNTEKSKLTEAELLFRHPGLNFFELHEANSYNGPGLYDGVRSADWMIFLSDKWLNKLHGIERVAAAMSPLFVHPYVGGAILQAGEFPELGNNDVGCRLPAYEQLAQVIEPIRVRNLTSCISAPDPKFPTHCELSDELMETWCGRFSKNL